MSMMVSFVLSFFPRDVLDEILNLIGSVSEGFPSYSFIFGIQVHNDKLYRGIANRHSPVCSSFCLFLFLSLQIFRQRHLYNRLR